MSDHHIPAESVEIATALAVVAQYLEIRQELGDIRRRATSLHEGQEKILMALDAEGQFVVKAISDATDELSNGATMILTAVRDLADKAAAGQMTPLELRPALQPSLDALQAIANTLRKTATQNDPAVNRSAAPIPEIPKVPLAPAPVANTPPSE